uniref:Protein kinase domain-containing protein n=1 Tax=Arcella intermedia TaxID=1963864 RepID=A0A6B2KZP1_9EUKA
MYDLEKSNSSVAKLHLKMTVSGVNLVKRKTGRGMSRKENTPVIFLKIKEYIRTKNILALQEYLKTVTPEDVNVKLPRSGNSPLHEACIEKEELLLNTLLKVQGIDVNLKNEDENTPLHYFCAKWTSPDYLTSFQLFIKQGANVDSLNSNGETPIFKAIFNPSIRALLMEALIEKGAKLNHSTHKGEGLLHYAVRLNRADLVRLILQNRPSLDLNIAGETPEKLAVSMNGSQSIQKYLQQISELFKWLDDNDLEELKGIFVKSEITLDLLPDITDDLLKQMGVDKVGTRLKILKACEKEKEAGKYSSAKAGPSQKDEISTDLIGGLENEFQGAGEGILDGNSFEYLKHLGTGAAGDVYKGLYNGNIVAIKVLSVKSAEKEVDEFKKEFEIFRAVRHNNVVKFIGVSMKPRLCMVMEYCGRGSLYHNMKDPAVEISWSRAIGFCKETCQGLKALHGNNPVILHRDLKSLNLLVSQDWRIKLADFGLSRFATAENLETMKQMRGTYQYLDPEVYNGGTFAPASDIYSTTVIFWEIVQRVLTGTYWQPYAEFKNLHYDFQIIIQSAKEHLRPTLSPGCPKSFEELIRKGWAPLQVDRPSLDEIVCKLEAIEEEYKNNQQEWDGLRN